MTTTYAGGGTGIYGNRASVSYYNPTGVGSTSASITNLLGGSKWGGGIGSGVSLTTSFSTLNSRYGYSTGDTARVTAFSLAQITAARSAMAGWAATANITFTETTDSATNAGDIRWGQSNDFSNPTAYAWYPSTTANGGDIWFGPNYPSYYNNPVVGTYGYQTFVHELGHALGLGHPHTGPVAPVAGQDQLKYSVMSYRSYNGDDLNGYSNAFYPTSPMLNDIRAIQFLYGANMAYKTGNDTYRWDASRKIFETIWDAGGIDTLDGSNQSQYVILDLRSGYWSSIGVSFWNGQSYVRDCLTIAYGATIENATGSAYNDTLTGNDVANILNGGTGADRMQGGLGNDSYYVDNTGDVITETSALASEIDSVFASISYTLGANLENLTLTGGAAINGAGNALANTLVGNSAGNILDGGAGADILNGGVGSDRMIGGLGNDSYYVDNVGDIISETSTLASEIDSVFASISYTLGANLENVALLGTAAINATGNTFANTLIGNSAANVLSGGAGADTIQGGLGNDSLFGGTGNDYLTGGAGSDNFVFDSALNSTGNRDAITDFTHLLDKIWLDRTIFTRLSTLGTLNSAFFRASANGLARDSNDYVVYNTTSGALLYDIDGTGAGVSVQFATLTTKPSTVSAADFFVVA